MKYTGYALLVMGVVIVAYWGLRFLVTQPGIQAGQMPFLASPDRTDSIAMLSVAAVSVGVGVCLLVFGGRGYIETNNPSVHN